MLLNLLLFLGGAVAGWAFLAYADERMPMVSAWLNHGLAKLQTAFAK